jgi:hypothetical protein
MFQVKEKIVPALADFNMKTQVHVFAELDMVFLYLM